MVAGATQSDEFQVGLKNLDIALQSSVKDLRSQVVREACITIAYLAQTLENRFDKMAEYLLQHLINLIQNSAKVSKFCTALGLYLIERVSLLDNGNLRRSGSKVHN